MSEGGTVKTSPASHFSEGGFVEKYKGPNGTVGAVAVDCYGNMAAATSTGGMTNKMPGRVGDTAVVGAVRLGRDSCSPDTYGFSDVNCAVHDSDTWRVLIMLLRAHMPTMQQLRFLQQATASSSLHTLLERQYPRTSAANIVWLSSESVSLSLRCAFIRQHSLEQVH